MKRLTIKNRAITRETLLAEAERIDGAWTGLRITSLLLIMAGWSSASVAKLFNLSRTSVTNWIKKANKEGLKSIQDKPRSGRPALLNENIFLILKEALRKSPQEFGFNRLHWDSTLLIEFLKNNLNISIKQRQARNWLKKLGLGKKLN